MSQEENGNRLALYRSHNAKPEQFGLVSLGVVFGVVAAITLIQDYCTEDVYVIELMSLIGVLVGYLTGAYTHQTLAILIKNRSSIASSCSLFVCNKTNASEDEDLGLRRQITRISSELAITPSK